MPSSNGLVVIGAGDRALRHDAVADDPSLAVDVAHEQLQRAHALGHAGRQLGPLRGLDHPRDRVDAELLRIVGVAEAHAALAGVAGDGLAQLAQVKRVQRLAQASVVLCRVRGARALVEGQLGGARVGARRRVGGRGRTPRLDGDASGQPRRNGQGARRRCELSRRGLRHAAIVSGRRGEVVRPTSKKARRVLDCP